MKEVIKGRVECMTVPESFPAMFDQSFEFDPEWIYIPRETQKSVALAHAWMRARDFGDPLAEEKLMKFSRYEIEQAQKMSLRQAVEIMPEIANRLDKPIDEYGRVGSYAYQIPALEYRHLWEKKWVKQREDIYTAGRELYNEIVRKSRESQSDSNQGN